MTLGTCLHYQSVMFVTVLFEFGPGNCDLA
jgi:hypothetical protein